MPFTNAAWDGGAVESGQEPEAFCRCCLIDLNEGGEKSKAACKLPVRSRPGGSYNTNAIAAAAAAQRPRQSLDWKEEDCCPRLPAT